MRCTACQAALPAEARFCPACGQPVPDPVPTPDTAALPLTAGKATGDSPASSDASLPAPDEPKGQPAPPSPPDHPAAPGEPAMPRSSAASASAPAPGRNRTVTLLGILSGLLLLALLASGALAYVELDRRQARERALGEQIASLSQANRDFQTQVQSLTSERDRLATERDQLIGERDRLQSRLNELMATNAEQEKRIQELTGQVQEQSRQLSQVREEATRQQQRAETAENIGSILTRVVLLDDQIHNEFDNLIDAMTDMQNAYRYGDRIAFANAYERGLQAARRLDQLFAQRDQLLAQLGF
ncbi:zinc ribbon domain-containing protein [Thermomicrobium roseum]|nr:zinc ribbon domain-containing protein [Thermomicrobium roseum]